MEPLKLTNSVHWVGVNNPELRVFDIIMETKMGTTYNSYLIEDEKITIVDTVKDGYFDQYLKNIKSIIGDKKIDYIVVQHTELDHSGSLKELLKEYPEAQVVGSKAAVRYLKGIINMEFNSIDASGELSIGKKTLRFINAPNLHWPDSIFTYLEDEKILFTCDFMGCHYSPSGCITDSCSGNYETEMKYYFDVIMGPFKKFVNMALDKIENTETEIIAPSHGPVHIDDREYYKNLYKTWAKEAAIEEKNIQIFYVSAYGNTEKVANHLKDAIEKRGIKAGVHEITTTPLEKLVSLVEKSSGILVGSPTINQDAVEPAWNLLAHVSAIVNRGKIAGAFGSYGWSGESVPMLSERLKSLKFNVIDPGFKFNFVPSEEELKLADEFADNFLGMLK